MSEDARMRTATMLSLTWDGSPLNRVRAGEAPSMIFGRRVSADVMVQPLLASQFLSDPALRNQGFLSRVLTTAPESLMGTRFCRDPDPADCDTVARYSDHLAQILIVPLPIASRPRGALMCRPVGLSPDAKVLWVQFHNRVEDALKKGGALREIAGFGAKLAEHAARMAGITALVEDISAGTIEARHMEGGIEPARHYGQEALRLPNTSSVDEDLMLAAQVGEWLRARYSGRLVSAVEVYQRGPKPARNAKVAYQMLQILEAHFWIVRVPGTHDVDGNRRSEVWFVVPEKS
jgi:hypothetical protein